MVAAPWCRTYQDPILVALLVNGPEPALADASSCVTNERKRHGIDQQLSSARGAAHPFAGRHGARYPTGPGFVHAMQQAATRAVTHSSQTLQHCVYDSAALIKGLSDSEGLLYGGYKQLPGSQLGNNQGWAVASPDLEGSC
jgi:hypothetical protein